AAMSLYTRRRTASASFCSSLPSTSEEMQGAMSRATMRTSRARSSSVPIWSCVITPSPPDWLLLRLADEADRLGVLHALLGELVTDRCTAVHVPLATGLERED